VQNGRQIAADRYSYLACLGWALLGGVLVETCWRRWGGRLMGRTLILGAGALTIAGLGVLTSNQLAIWQNSETLWTYALSNEPSLVAYENLGMAVAERGDLQGALENFQQALQIDPNDAEVHNDMGATLIALGKTDTAIPHFREAVRNKPNLANAHYGLGYALSLQGEMGAAIQEYQTALKLNPGYEAARRDLAKARALIYPRGQPPRSEWFEQ
jgi:tetratricopeptide (TPR) repeat protein